MTTARPRQPTSILGVAVRDLARLRVVVSTVVRHGFGEVVQRSQLARFFPDGSLPDERDATLEGKPAALRFRKLLEALGPTWIKFGQILSSRPDLIPKDYREALAELQDNAPVLAYALVEKAVEEGLGRPVGELFADFEATPLATASIAQTHLATTHDGRRVVVKVQRPGIEPQMRGDLDLLYLAARAIEATIDEAEVYRPSEMVTTFERDLVRELHFGVELSNLLTARTLLDPTLDVEVPEPLPELSSRTVLTMSYFEGRALRALEPRSDEAKAAVEKLLHYACHQVFHDGFFHADPHPGNLMVNAEGTVCVIDWGLAGRLSVEQREDLVRLILAAISGDANTIARVLLKMGTPMGRIRMAQFKADIVRIRSRHLVVGRLDDVDSTAFVQAFIDAAQRYRIQLNPSYALIVKAAVTLEGVVRSLHPDVDLVAIARPYVDDIVRSQLTPAKLIEQIASGATGLGGLIRDIPGHLDQVLHDVETGHLQTRPITPTLDLMPERLHVGASRVSLAMFSASMTLAAALLLPDDPTSVGGVPVLSVVLITLAVLGWLVSWWWHFVGQGRRIKVSPLVSFLLRVLPEDDDPL